MCISTSRGKCMHTRAGLAQESESFVEKREREHDDLLQLLVAKSATGTKNSTFLT